MFRKKRKFSCISIPCLVLFKQQKVFHFLADTCLLGMHTWSLTFFLIVTFIKDRPGYQKWGVCGKVQNGLCNFFFKFHVCTDMFVQLYLYSLYTYIATWMKKTYLTSIKPLNLNSLAKSLICLQYLKAYIKRTSLYKRKS